MKLLSVEDARARFLLEITRLAAERVDLIAAFARILAEDVIAHRDQPPFAASAMDGWAVRAADGSGPRTIVGESAAGQGFEGVVGAFEAVRISTGAAMPAGADSVVAQEDVRRQGEQVLVPAVTLHAQVRIAGLDFRAGQVLLASGLKLDARCLALAAAAGRSGLAVARRPRVAILATGNELARPGTTPGPFQIFDSITTALTALVRNWGGEAVPLPAVGDDLDATMRAICGIECEILVIVGGASVGDHDLVKPAMAALGSRPVVQSVAVRPGKPTWSGVLADGRLVLGLPGNPASAMVSAELFLGPALRTFQGAPPGPDLVVARLAEALPANGEREHWMRARLVHDTSGQLVATAAPEQDSSLVGVMATANGLVRRIAGAPAARAGDLVDGLPLGPL